MQRFILSVVAGVRGRPINTAPRRRRAARPLTPNLVIKYSHIRFLNKTSLNTNERDTNPQNSPPTHTIVEHK